MWQGGGNDGGGGGYFNESNVGGTPSADNKKVYKAQNVVPVAIAQLVNCKENSFKICNTDVNLVTIVARLIDKQIQSTSATYTLQDDTGTIQAVIFLAKDEETSTQPEYSLNKYYRLFGSFQSQHGKENRLMMYKMTPITKLNELTTHLLEVIYSPLKLEEVENMVAQSGTNQFAGNSNSFGANANQFAGGAMNPFGGNQGIKMDPNASRSDSIVSSLTQQQQMVYKIINQCTDSRGLDKTGIPGLLNNRVSVKELDNILEFLASEGHIYTTVDDVTYRATDI